MGQGFGQIQPTLAAVVIPKPLVPGAQQTRILHMGFGISCIPQGADTGDDIFVCGGELLQVLCAHGRANGACRLERGLISIGTVCQLYIQHNGLLLRRQGGRRIRLQGICSQLLGRNGLNNRALRLLPGEVDVIGILFPAGGLGLRLLLAEKWQLQVHVPVFIVHQVILAVEERTAAQKQQHKDHDQNLFPQRRPAMIAVIPLGSHAAPPLFLFTA